jgi:hypothetical protein
MPPERDNSPRRPAELAAASAAALAICTGGLVLAGWALGITPSETGTARNQDLKPCERRRKQSPAKIQNQGVLLAGGWPWLVSLAAQVLFGDAQRVQEPLHEGFELAGTCIALGVAMLLLLRLRHENAPPHPVCAVAALFFTRRSLARTPWSQQCSRP